MKRYLRIYLLAVALPALLLALFGAVQMRLIGEWLHWTEVEGLRSRAELAAARELSSVRDLLDRRLDRIASCPDPESRLAVLRELAGGDRFVRAAFLWREGEGCVWPRRTGSTEEERRFLNRYESLFGGAAPWVPPDPSAPIGAAPAPPTRGYRAWASGDRPELLAWVRTAPGEIAGFEFEKMAWLADLQVAGFAPAVSLRGGNGPLAAELRDESGAVLAPSRLASSWIPCREAPLAPLFPRWLVRVAPAEGIPLAHSRERLLLLAAAFFGLLLLSLVAGGFLLLRAARRERLDALRKTDFVDNVSHELKTPLSGIRLSAELLAEGRLPDGPRRDKAVRSILAESDRLDRLVSNLLDFGRLERNRRRFDLQRVDLAALLEEMQNAQCTMHNEGGAAVGPDIVHCAFRIVHCERGLAALADPDALRRILSNLLDNAAKYAPGAPPEVSVRAAGNAVELVVADRGPGVPPGLEEKIFERFFRADDSLARRANGSGIGLSLARGLARGMGGDLIYRPREGGGAEFVLTLPAEREKPRPGGADAPRGGVS